MNIKELAKKYDLTKQDFWELPQRAGTWIVTHNACEKIADIEKITFDYPEIHNGGKEVAMIGKAKMRIKGKTKYEDKEVWSTGEASPDNCKNKYMWAMAEKRLKDRLTLKLINAAEYGIYSEEEADSFKDSKQKQKLTGKEKIGDYMDEETVAFFQTALKSLPSEAVNNLRHWLKYKHTADEIDKKMNECHRAMDEYLNR